MCREYEQIDLDQVGEEVFGEIKTSEKSDDEVSTDRTESLSIPDLNSPHIKQVDQDDGSLPHITVNPIFLRFPRLIVTLLIGFAVFSIECYLFDFPEFQSEMNRHTQILGGLTTAVGGVALLTTSLKR